MDQVPKPPLVSRKQRFFTFALISTLLFPIIGVVGYALSTTHIEVDIASGRERHSFRLLGVTLYQVIEETEFSRLAGVQPGTVEPVWRTAYKGHRVAGPRVQYRHGGAPGALRSLVFILQQDPMTHEQREALIQATFAAMQREENITFAWTPRESIELLGDGKTVFQVTLVKSHVVE